MLKMEQTTQTQTQTASHQPSESFQDYAWEQVRSAPSAVLITLLIVGYIIWRQIDQRLIPFVMRYVENQNELLKKSTNDLEMSLSILNEGRVASKENHKEILGKLEQIESALHIVKENLSR